MGAEFDKETITLKAGKGLMEALREVLEKKGMADRMDSDYGLFILHDVNVLSVKDEKVECMVEYEYGG